VFYSYRLGSPLVNVLAYCFYMVYEVDLHLLELVLWQQHDDTVLKYVSQYISTANVIERLTQQRIKRVMMVTTTEDWMKLAT
jgi:hypothetical protein